jgi:hypothetical protein
MSIIYFAKKNAQINYIWNPNMCNSPYFKLLKMFPKICKLVWKENQKKVLGKIKPFLVLGRFWPNSLSLSSQAKPTCGPSHLAVHRLPPRREAARCRWPSHPMPPPRRNRAAIPAAALDVYKYPKPPPENPSASPSLSFFFTATSQNPSPMAAA